MFHDESEGIGHFYNVDYWHEGKEYSFIIRANSTEDADNRIKSIKNYAVYSGRKGYSRELTICGNVKHYWYKLTNFIWNIFAKK